MKSDKPNNRQLVHVDAKKAEQLRKKFKQFKNLYQDEQSKFSTSAETSYYIVSCQYLNQWAEFCESNQSERYEPNPINQNIMDAGGQLKKGLSEAQDFQIFNEKLYSIIKPERGFEINRQAVFVGKQKKVPIYLDVVKYVKISYRDIEKISNGDLEQKQISMRSIQISLQDTIKNLTDKIRKTQEISRMQKIRLWRNDKDLSLEDLYNYIRQKTKRSITIMLIDGKGKVIDDQDAKIQDLNLSQGDYFIAQVSDSYSSWYFKNSQQSKCEGCYKYKKLPFPCGCKQVAYCTEECQERDKRFHLRDCKFVEQQQLNEQIEMKITDKSMLGRVGLNNLGNTCFMNSCLQCLSNTVNLTNYFLKSYYDKQINKDNPLGSKGKLAKNYARFIKNMWCESSQSYSPHNLKAAVAKLNPIFSGYAQHDSQQFFSYLVDGIHQDLNRVLKKPYVQSVDSKGRQDKVVALESWIAYTQRNQSIIVDLLTGQYKSKVICPTCNLESITFDPFTTVSLPIPEQAVTSVLKYFVIYQNNTKQAQRMSFTYTKADTKQWLQSATALLKKEPEDFVFYVLTVFENIYGFKYTSKAEILHKVENESKNIFLLQLTEQQKNIKSKIELVTRFCKPPTSSYEKQFDNLWFKRPFFFERSTATVLTLYKRMLQYVYSVYTDKVDYDKFEKKMLADRPFTLFLKYKKSIEKYYNRVQVKFDKEILLDDDKVLIDDIIKKIGISDNECEIDVRLTRQTKKLFEFQKWKSFSDAMQKVSKKDYYHKQETNATLDQCFSIFEQKQQLEPGNQWYCPRCKQHRLATKQMTIYKAPQILILHLKRFKNKGIIRKQKNQTNVSFPLVLNLEPYVIDPTPMSTYIAQLKNQNKYLEPSFSAEFHNSKPEYQLYAISNHYGGLGGGHYTAYAKNNDKWFQYNDSSVRSASQDSIKGSGAYMLFYKRKGGLNIV